jgi:hypothetical protein
MQTEIDFDNITHTAENNRHSEQILYDNYDRLNKNCKILCDALYRGERLTGITVVTKYGMIEYRRRFADLKAAGVPVKDATIKGGAKEWFI